MVQVSPSELVVFAQIAANHPRYLEYLRAVRDDFINIMVLSSDIQAIHRSQGAVIFIDQQINMLVSAHKHLRQTS